MNNLTEHEIQNQILDLLRLKMGTIWRVNVLGGFTGKYVRNRDGSVTIYRPNWVTSGVPKGFPDLIGIKPVTITQDMIGKTIGQFCFIEVKAEKGKISKEQKTMHKLMRDVGACGGIAKSVNDVISLIYS